MAGVDGGNQNGNRALGFEGFLNNLQDWDMSRGGSRSKAQVPRQEVMSSRMDKESGVQRYAGTLVKDVHKQNPMIKEVSFKSVGKVHGHARNPGVSSHLSTSLFDGESPPTAASEKDLGNEYFKQKNYHKAIECYSSSIALSPTSVAFANRAMAYLKMKRYEEAEIDCTEALNLDDRYVKAYSRRATARKELAKLKLSLEDSEFALRLEPNNQELKKLYIETKALYNDDVVKNISGATKSTSQGVQGRRLAEVQVDISGVHSPSSASETIASTSTQSSIEKNLTKNQGQRPVHELANRAACLAMSTAPTIITTPKSAYEFEVSWRQCSNDCSLQANLLKSIPPGSLPQLFKNALSAPLLIEIVKCTATFFMGETELAISILDNLTRVSRFDMIVMCLTALDHADLRRIWDEIFSSEDIQSEHAEKLSRLRHRYCPGER